MILYVRDVSRAFHKFSCLWQSWKPGTQALPPFPIFDDKGAKGERDSERGWVCEWKFLGFLEFSWGSSGLAWRAWLALGSRMRDFRGKARDSSIVFRKSHGYLTTQTQENECYTNTMSNTVVSFSKLKLFCLASLLCGIWSPYKSKEITSEIFHSICTITTLILKVLK